MTTNQQLKAHCEDVIANPQEHSEMVLAMATALLPCLEAVPVVEVTKWMPLGIDGGVSKFLQPVGNLPDFGSLLYTAPPVLKLPDVSEGDPGKLHDVRTRHDFSNGFRFAIEEVKRLNAPHAAPIEPICSTGGAEWVKVSDVEIEQELISLQNGNGQLRGDSFYQEALKELLALRKALSEPAAFQNNYTGKLWRPEQQPGAEQDKDVYTPLYRKPADS